MRFFIFVWITLWMKAISQVYQECLLWWRKSKFLIIDVRQNGEKGQTLYISLYYIFLRRIRAMIRLTGTMMAWKFYTERNVDLRLKDFEDWMQREEISLKQLSCLKIWKGLIHHRGRLCNISTESEFFQKVRIGHYLNSLYLIECLSIIWW